jgi:hypothetical protein
MHIEVFLSAYIIRSENKQIQPNLTRLINNHPEIKQKITNLRLGTLNEMTIFMQKIKLNGFNQEAQAYAVSKIEQMDCYLYRTHTHRRRIQRFTTLSLSF